MKGGELVFGLRIAGRRASRFRVCIVVTLCCSRGLCWGMFVRGFVEAYSIDFLGSEFFLSGGFTCSVLWEVG